MAHVSEASKLTTLIDYEEPAKVSIFKFFRKGKNGIQIRKEKEKQIEIQGKLDAINKSQAMIEFNMDGTVITANDNFLKTLGYDIREIEGRHHRMFCEDSYTESGEYRAFWEKLNRGEFDSGEYKRIGKGGKAVWIQATYNPIMDLNGKPFKVVKFATDVTERKLKNLEFRGKIEAINKSQGVIEFNMDGTVITANPIFLNVVGYSMGEIQGQNHRMFCEISYANSLEYRAFWEKLNRGEFDAGEYKRIGKGGKEVWIQATYNPIMDLNGKPYKVVKFAIDMTEQKLRNTEFRGKTEAINESQGVIEFNMDGTIITANPIFLNVVGFSLGEIQGQHHRMFCEPAYANSPDYKAFWEKLNRGEFDTGEYERMGKGGREVWLQATYNPILDLNGKPFKVVNFAVDITEKNKAEQNIKSVFTKLSKVSEILGSSAQEMTSVSQQMATNAEETSAQVTFVSSASEEVSTNLQTVTSGTEEMSASIKEISQNAGKAAKTSESAVELAEKTNVTVSKLGESSVEIGQVIKVITSIAEQTNLLALNATIEAARAGEAGKGFAVVANEVRELANQTAKATEDISSKIGAIQLDTKNSVDAIGEITAVINEISDISSTIASAVEEQTATTNEMARNVAEAAKGSEGISKNIAGVAKTAESTTRGAADSQAAATELSKLAADLQGIVNGSGTNVSQEEIKNKFRKDLR